MKIKVFSWNLKYKKKDLNQIKLINRFNADIFLFQEVHERFYRNLKKTGKFKWAAFSLNHRPPQENEGNSRRMGCAVMGTKGELINSGLLENLDFPERTIASQVKIESKIFKICSFHIPPGASWGKIKPETMKKISFWLQDKNEGPSSELTLTPPN